jgi:N-acetylglucosaminyldiphosphoundecaprenol N-acetyl-beta-D-mannosaminyltransferase
VTYEGAAARIVAWAEALEASAACGASEPGLTPGRTVLVANTHMLDLASTDPALAAALDGADLVTPDGVPVVWALRTLGLRRATRVYGPDLTRAVARAAAAAGVPVGVHGGRPEVLHDLVARLTREAPGLRVAYADAPPVRPVAPVDAPAEAREAAALRASGARIVFVGLGCPKQERWMARQAPRVPAVLIGVGAAFDLLAGHVRQAPPWLRRAGLEWAFRLGMEPRRLAGRYLRHNPRFVARFAAQCLRGGRS